MSTPPAATPRPTTSRARAAQPRRGGARRARGAARHPHSRPGRVSRAHSVGELDRVEHRDELVVLPHRVLGHPAGRAPHDETVGVHLDRKLPGDTEAPRWERRVLRRPGGPGAAMLRTAGSRRGSPSASGTSSPTPRSTVACTVCSGPCSGRRCRSNASARQRHGEERARPRKRSGVGVGTRTVQHRCAAPVHGVSAQGPSGSGDGTHDKPPRTQQGGVRHTSWHVLRGR